MREATASSLQSIMSQLALHLIPVLLALTSDYMCSVCRPEVMMTEMIGNSDSDVRTKKPPSDGRGSHSQASKHGSRFMNGSAHPFLHSCKSLPQ